jgi:NAD(P)-dependent dehydrogenase (short-subunit alcohol dehydrogenase family)
MQKHKPLVVLSGVTKGLGRAMAEEFIARGAKVVGCGRTKAAIQELNEKFPEHFWALVDVTQPTQVECWAQTVLQEFGAPDYLVNNAATINRSARLWEIKPAEFEAVLAVNIGGVFNLIRYFVPAMVKKNHGVIINFSSGWGRTTSPEVAPYCATKYAIEGLTLALAQELPRGMAAIPLNPGIIDTEMLRSCFGGSAAAYPKPQDWAKKSVPFILSLNARHNGQSLTVPGTTED